MRISVIIPTLNEEKYLPRILDCLDKQTYKDFEIIVADAGSKDGTKQIAKEHGARVVKGGLPGPGRNKGAEAARGELLVFLDADVKIPKGFLKKVHDEMQERYLDLATCEFRPLSNLKIDKVAHKIANMFIKLNQYSKPHAPGFCIFVTKRLFDRVGGFDETVTLAEDHEFVSRASKVRPLRVLEKARVNVSIRRLTKEGRLKLAGKYIRAEMKILRYGKITDHSIEYEFANFGKDNHNKSLDKIERKLTRLGKQYRKLNRHSKKYKERLHKLKEELKKQTFILRKMLKS
ncbi:MAG: glycosyltransferase [Candidatus Nanoarchaeia archaeon]